MYFLVLASVEINQPTIENEINQKVEIKYLKRATQNQIKLALGDKDQKEI